MTRKEAEEFIIKNADPKLRGDKDSYYSREDVVSLIVAVVSKHRQKDDVDSMFKKVKSLNF